MRNSKAFPNRQVCRSSQSRRLQTVFITSWKGFPQKESEVISRLKTFKARISVDSFADGRVFRSQRSSDDHGKSHDGIQQKKDREHLRSQQKTAREVFNFDLGTKSVPLTEKERSVTTKIQETATAELSIWSDVLKLQPRARQGNFYDWRHLEIQFPVDLFLDSRAAQEAPTPASVDGKED